MPHGSTERQDRTAHDELQRTTLTAWWDRFRTILDSQLSGRHKLAMLVIAGYAGDSNQCWASTRAIANALSLTAGAAARTINELHAAGFLERVPRKHAPSILHVRWERFGIRPQPAKSSIDDSDDRRFRSPQPAKAQVDTTYKNTKVNTQSNTAAARTSADTAAPHAAAAMQSVVEAWNELAESVALPTVQTLNPDRRKALWQRLSEPDWQRDWRAGLQRIRGSTFLLGGGNKGWKASFDWFVKSDSLTKIMEGKYADGKPTAATSDRSRVRSNDPVSSNRCHFEEI